MLDRVPLDELRRKFWLLPGIGLAMGLVLGFVMVEVDYSRELDPGIFTFTDLESARKVLQTIATVTVSVAGLSFSITIVALQLASQQLSPRVLKTFQADRLAQAVLAVFVGTFMYALIVLVKLTNQGVPRLSLTVAILGAVAAFALFVAFIHHVVVSLKASTVIKRIADDGSRALQDRWPSQVGGAAPDANAAQREVAQRLRRPGAAVLAPDAGFVSDIDGSALLALAERRQALVVRRASSRTGSMVLELDVVAAGARG